MRGVELRLVFPICCQGTLATTDVATPRDRGQIVNFVENTKFLKRLNDTEIEGCGANPSSRQR